MQKVQNRISFNRLLISGFKIFSLFIIKFSFYLLLTLLFSISVIFIAFGNGMPFNHEITSHNLLQLKLIY